MYDINSVFGIISILGFISLIVWTLARPFFGAKVHPEEVKITCVLNKEEKYEFIAKIDRIPSLLVKARTPETAYSKAVEVAKYMVDKNEKVSNN